MREHWRIAAGWILVVVGIVAFLFGVWMFLSMQQGRMYALLTLGMGVASWILAAVAVLAGVALLRWVARG